MSVKEHYDAVRALLPPTVRVYAWSVPDTPVYPYVCIWGDPGNESSGGPDGDSLEDSPDVLDIRARATYAGLNGDSVLIMCRNVRAALSRKTPVVDGWRTSKLRQSSLQDVQTDTSVTLTGGAHPVFAVDEFALTSSKF